MLPPIFGVYALRISANSSNVIRPASRSRLAWAIRSIVDFRGLFGVGGAVFVPPLLALGAEPVPGCGVVLGRGCWGMTGRPVSGSMRPGAGILPGSGGVVGLGVMGGRGCPGRDVPGSTAVGSSVPGFCPGGKMIGGVCRGGLPSPFPPPSPGAVGAVGAVVLGLPVVGGAIPRWGPRMSPAIPSRYSLIRPGRRAMKPGILFSAFWMLSAIRLSHSRNGLRSRSKMSCRNLARASINGQRNEKMPGRRPVRGGVTVRPAEIRRFDTGVCPARGRCAIARVAVACPLSWRCSGGAALSAARGSGACRGRRPAT